MIELSQEKTENLPRTFVFKAWVCDMGHHYHFMVDYRELQNLKDMFEEAGTPLLIQEQEIIPSCDEYQHRLIYALKSAHSVQGLEWGEGQSSVDGLESLIAKFIELRDAKT